MALQVSVASAAELLGLKERQVRTLLGSGRLRGSKVGKGWVIWQASVEAYQRRRRGPGRPPKKRSRRPQLPEQSAA